MPPLGRPNTDLGMTQPNSADVKSKLRFLKLRPREAMTPESSISRNLTLKSITTASQKSFVQTPESFLSLERENLQLKKSVRVVKLKLAHQGKQSAKA